MAAEKTVSGGREGQIYGVTTPEFTESKKQPETPKKMSLRKKLVRLGLATGVIGLGGAAGVYEAYQHIPGIHRTFDSHFGIVSPKDVPDTFNNNAKKQLFGESNTTRLTSEEINQIDLVPKIDKKNNILQQRLPFTFSQDTIVTMERFSPNTQRGPNGELADQYDQIEFTFSKKGALIHAPDTSHMELVRGVAEWGQDSNLAGYVRFYHYYEKEDTTVVWFVSGSLRNGPATFIDPTIAFNPLLSMQNFDNHAGRGTNYESFPIIEGGTAVMATTQDNQRVAVRIDAFRGKAVGPEAKHASLDFLLKPVFFTDSSGKLILQKN